MAATPGMHQLCIFMHSEDESNFCKSLVMAVPSVRFIDMSKQGLSQFPTYNDSIGSCAGAHVTFVDSNIVSEELFQREYVRAHPSGKGWVYAMVGGGLVSMLRSKPPGFSEVSLLNGEIRASVPAEDAATAAFVSDVMAVARSGGLRVFPVDPASGVIGKKADRKFVAWPSAAVAFSGENGANLVNGRDTLFVAKIEPSTSHVPKA